MTEFCWAADTDNYYHGPFVSINEAKDDIIEHYLGLEGNEITISEVEYINPAAYISIETDDILDQMDGRVSSDWGFDDLVFNIPEDFKKQAQDNLDYLLAAWADEYVKTDEWIPGKEVLKTTFGEIVSEFAGKNANSKN